jgi:hypothetical protein
VNLKEKYKINFSYFFKKWSMNQDKTITEQLHLGVRYFDLRNCEDENEKFLMCHGLYGLPFEDFLIQFQTFLGVYQKEILIISVTSRSSVKNHSIFISLIQKYLGNWLLESKNGFITIGEMISINKRVILFYSSSAFAKDNIWSQSYLDSNWADTNDVNILMKKEISFVQQKSGNPNKFFIPQWILTVTQEEIEKSIYQLLNIPGYSNFNILDGNKRLGFSSNQKLNEFLLSIQNYRINSIMVDYISGVDALSISRSLNDDCNDAREFRSSTLTKGKCKHLNEVENRCFFADDFMKLNCKRTCGLCERMKSHSGDHCFLNNDCKSNYCHLTKKICLSEEPRALYVECGTHYQCKSGYCNSNTMICDSESFLPSISFFIACFSFLFSFVFLLTISSLLYAFKKKMFHQRSNEIEIVSE